MRGAWNGLQALFLKDCPYAYYVHCFAHQLQLALVAAAKDVPDVWKFFSKLNSIVNLVGVSPKRHMELKNIKAAELADMLASGELATAYNSTKSFEFCFLLFLLKEVIGITDCLCQVLQRKSQDIINALDLVFGYNM
jgi:hypothetical protein